jgi:hypothetical protein
VVLAAVHAGAVFDVSNSQAGGQLQAGQSLELAGTLRGNLIAGAGSAVTLAPTSVVAGGLSAADATLIAAGTIEGNVVASNTTLRVGAAGIEVIREAVYVDATHGAGGNTRLATGGVFQPTTNPDWQIRSPFGNGSVVYQGGSDSPGTAATLQTTVGGLEPGASYRVYVNFWDASGSRWRILAGTQAWLFAALNASKVLPFISTGQLDLPALRISLLFMPLTPIGSVLGQRFLRNTSKEGVYAVLSGAMLISGVMLLWQGWQGQFRTG